MSQNLEALIDDHSKMMALQLIQAAECSGSEEDLRHECNKLIDQFITNADLNIKGRHEYGLAGGRIDSKYGGVVIEYKVPTGVGRITEDKNSSGTKAVVSQITRRFHDLEAHEHIGMERIFGVGCDGKMLVFVRFHGGVLVVEDPQPVTSHTVKRLLRAIISIGARGLSFTPDNLTTHFGSESRSAQDGVRIIHNLIHGTTNPKAQTFFRQWQILFGEVCGYDIHGRNTKVEILAEHYHIPQPNPAELLFSVHTYYAIFTELLAAEIVSSLSPLGTSTLKKLLTAPTSAKLHDTLRSLEQGGIWTQLGIHNFLEGDLFAWYLDAWDENCTLAIRSMSQSLDQFDPTTLSVDPIESRDLLKQLYQQLFPRSVRHDLGEYYTPDWLAELVLDELGYNGDPDKRLLDPSCGSGTFLVMALNRVKAWYDEHRFQCGYGEDELLRKVLSNIIGFDLNPLAVMAARTNYLLAIRDLLRHIDNVELPVYLCDSIMIPSEFRDLITGGTGGCTKVHRLRTSAGEFIIPNEVAGERHHINRYADTLEFCIANRYGPEEFLQKCKTEGIPVTEARFHKDLYNHLLQLDAEKINGVWARIIKNSFAPLFVGKVDYVVGNPPWINWESLPEDYRDSMQPLWQEYGLFTLSGSAGRLGGGKKDISMLFVYSTADSYLNTGGRLGFVITQSIFKTQGAGDGFRRLQSMKKNSTFYLKPIEVIDLSSMQVFEGATNRTAVFVCEKRSRAFSYPVRYSVWRGVSRISQEVTLKEARSIVTEIQMGAQPVDPDKPTSPWLTAPKRALSGIRKVIGQSGYHAFAGCCTWLNSVYWIRILGERPNGDLLIENLHDVGRIRCQHVQVVIEPDLVYPLLRGRDVQRWHVEPSVHIILPQDPQTRRGIPESIMKLKYPKTFAYLRQFEGNSDRPLRGTLRGRSGFRQYFRPTDPFYSIYNVGPYTMARWKVLWPEVGYSVKAGVCGPNRVDKEAKPSLPDHTLVSVACDSGSEAYFLAGLLNSTPAQAASGAYIVMHPSPHIMQNIAIPQFSNEDTIHKQLSELSRRCHKATSKGDDNSVAALETEIDCMAARIWGITNNELLAIQEACVEMGLTQPEPEVSKDDNVE